MIEPKAYRVWAPADGLWSKWVKPVLFAYLDGSPGEALPRVSLPSQTWLRSRPKTALVVDLPGLDSMEAGLSAVLGGYRPIPVYNTSPGAFSALDVVPIITRLKGASDFLANANLPDGAPPAFLLDVDRMRGKAIVKPGDYDNRWAVVPQDFPSANLLLHRKIDTVILICEHEVETDLAHVLMRWQIAGLKILQTKSLSIEPAPITVRKPYNFMSMLQRFSIFMGLRRNSAGGFGSVVPEEISSGGGFG